MSGYPDNMCLPYLHGLDARERHALSRGGVGGGVR